VFGDLLYVSAVEDSSLMEVAFAAMRRGSLRFAADWLAMAHEEHLGNQFLYAIRRTSGEIVWRVTLGGGHQHFGHTSGTPIVEDGAVVVVSPIAQVVEAVDAITGRLRWRHPMPRPVRGPPIAADGLILALDRDGYLNVLNTRTGLLVCEQHIGVGFDRAGAATSGRTAYFGSLDGTIYAEPLSALEGCAVDSPAFK
jgi:outer membrane protein assembly factor BamB